MKLTEKIFILLKDLRNFNEIFRNDVTDDNLKVTSKNEGFTLSPEGIHLKTKQREGSN